MQLDQSMLMPAVVCLLTLKEHPYKVSRTSKPAELRKTPFQGQQDQQPIIRLVNHQRQHLLEWLCGGISQNKGH